MPTTIGESISRIRNIIKAVNEDAFITDRYIFSIINKYSTFVVRKDSTAQSQTNFNSFYVTLPCVELIEVDKVEACCNDVKSNCTIMRTKNKIPVIRQGISGPLIKSVSSIDGSQLCYLTQPSIYVAMSKSTTFKYNTKKYYWYMNDYLYLPNVSWEAVRIDAIWDGDITSYICDNGDECEPKQDKPLGIPDYLIAEIEQLTIKEISMLHTIPVLDADNKISPLRS
jgi:hypothetical protein